MSEPFIFFVHIPKTAGSTFLTILMRRFGSRFYGSYSNIHGEEPLSHKQLKEFVHDYGSKYDCLASHRLSAFFPSHSAGRDCIGISFVRDPFDLFVSHYYFHRFHSAGFGKARSLNIGDYFEYAVVENNYPHYRDWQLKIFAGEQIGNRDAVLREIDRRIENRQLLLFETSQFDLACVLLSKMFPRTFGDCWFTRRNVSRRDQLIPEGLRSRFYEYVEGDFMLLEKSRLQTETLLREALPDEVVREALVKQLYRRSKRRYLANAPRAAIKRSLQYLVERL